MCECVNQHMRAGVCVPGIIERVRERGGEREREMPKVKALLEKIQMPCVPVYQRCLTLTGGGGERECIRERGCL